MKPIFLYGKHATQAALANQTRNIIEIFSIKPIDHPKHIPLRIVTRAQLDQYLPGSTHQGIAIRCMPLPEQHLQFTQKKNSVIIILDQIKDPQNIGAIIRNAVAFGADFIVITKNGSPTESGALAKAAAGCLEKIPLIRVNNLARSIREIKNNGYFCFALSSQASISIEKITMTEKIAFILGEEGRGVRPLVKKTCDSTIYIPILIDSINVSAAASIALYRYRLANFLNKD